MSKSEVELPQDIFLWLSSHIHKRAGGPEMTIVLRCSCLRISTHYSMRHFFSKCLMTSFWDDTRPMLSQFVCGWCNHCQDFQACFSWIYLQCIDICLSWRKLNMVLIRGSFWLCSESLNLLIVDQLFCLSHCPPLWRYRILIISVSWDWWKFIVIVNWADVF